MTVQQLQRLLTLSRTWHDVTVRHLAGLPREEQTDYLDRVIVAIAKGEADWRGIS